MLNDNVILKESNGIKYIQFKKLLELGINHCYTLKGDGIDFSTGSKYQEESLEKICKAINVKRENLIIPIQTHSINLKNVWGELPKEEQENVDGLISEKKGSVLASRNADCILFFFYDPVKKVIANIHSGWKGTFKKIAEKTVVKMITDYGSKAEDILCFINPCIRKCHFEVDEEVKLLCEEIFKFTGKLDSFIFKGDMIDGKQKYYIDTVEINKILLKDIGLKNENIYDSEICSMCHKDEIHSARAEGKKFTRAIALIEL